MVTRGDIMLLQFRVENYKSIGKEIVLDMTATNLKEHSDYVIENGKVNVLPVTALFGGNASGKTNILDALDFMQNKVKTSHKKDQDSFNAYVEPFMLDESLKNKPTEMEVFFTKGTKEYKYGFKIKENKILEEWLYERKLSNNETLWRGVFERTKNGIEYSNIKKYNKLNSFNEFIQEDMLVLTFLGFKEIVGIDIFNIVYGWFVSLWYLNSPKEVDISNGILSVYYTFSKNVDLKMLEKCKKFIQEFDLTINDLQVSEEKTSSGKPIYTLSIHHLGVPLSLKQESAGTIKMINLYLSLAVVLLTGGIWIVDELDTQLHPLLLRKIVKMFQNKDTNPNGAQLIFSSHNLIILDRREMRRDEIWFVEKDKHGQTGISSLAEYKIDNKTVRADVDYGKAYLAGRFGAVPFMEDE